MPWRWSKVAVISAETVLMASPLVAERPMAETLLLPMKSSWAVESGIMTWSSAVVVPPWAG